MRNSTLLCRRALLWIASLMLDILTRILRRIFKYIFFAVSSVWSVDYYHRILDGIYTETKSLRKS